MMILMAREPFSCVTMGPVFDEVIVIARLWQETKISCKVMVKNMQLVS